MDLFAVKLGSKRAIMNKYKKKSSLWGDLQSVNIISSMILYLSVYFPAILNAINNTLRFFTAKIFTPYFLVILLYMMLGNEVKLLIVSKILFAFIAFLTSKSISLIIGKTFFSIVETTDFSFIIIFPSWMLLIYLTS